MANRSDIQWPGFLPTTRTQIWSRLLSLLFGGIATKESVATLVHIDASPEAIWREILFYEEVPSRPPLLLAAMLSPIGTRGDKSQVGANIECRYQQGRLTKRITIVEQPHSICFDVSEQNLGIEDCAIAQSGSYRISRSDSGSEVMLTTNYIAFLYPRWLWSFVEWIALHQLHSHILEGVRKMVAAPSRSPQTFRANYTCRKEET